MIFLKRLSLLIVVSLAFSCTKHTYDVLPNPPPSPRPAPAPGPTPIPFPGPTPVPPVKPVPGPAPAPIGQAIPAGLFSSLIENVTTYAQAIAVVGTGNHATKRPYRDPLGTEYRYYVVNCPQGVREAILTFRNGLLVDKDVCY